MFPPIEHETLAGIVFYDDAKTDTVRALIRTTPFRERSLIKDLLRIEYYAINQIHDAHEAMDLRLLTERHPEHAAAILAEAEEKRPESFRDNRRESKIWRERALLKTRIERESWKRAGGLE